MKHTIFIIGMVLVVSAAFAGWYFWSVRSTTNTAAFDLSTTASSSSQQANAAPRTPPAGYSEYHSDVYHFSLFYPNDLTVKTYDEGGGAMTFIFQDTKTLQGFQIFVTPYIGTTISDERFKQDEPSGVRQNMADVSIGGAQAVSFFSTNVELGDTAEVWFIHGGYLYEATSLKPLAQWFSNIMQTWQFTL